MSFDGPYWVEVFMPSCSMRRRSCHSIANSNVCFCKHYQRRTHASQVSNPSVLKYISDLENVQINFTYRIRSIKHLSYPERLAVLYLESLELIRLNADLVMYYKILNNLISINFDYHFTVRTSSSISTLSSGPSILKAFLSY